MGEALVIEDYEDRGYDPFTALLTVGGEGRVLDPYPEFARMRHESPVWAVDIRKHFGVATDNTTIGTPNFTALGYKEVTRILNDPVAFSNKAYETNLGVFFGRSVTVMDPPEHSRFRRIFQKAFLPGAVADWGKVIMPGIVNRAIDAFVGRGKADLVNDFSLQFPFQFIMELMALPTQDHKTFQKLAFGQTFITFDPVHGGEATEKLKTYLTKLVNRRREHAARDNDLIHELAVVEVEGERLPDDVVISFFRQLMNAGGDTSYHGFSNLLAALLTHPQQLELVRADRSKIPQVIEEALRWESAVSFIFRTPTQEITLANVKIQPGDIINVCIGAANRDEQQYPEPDRFDISRAPQRTVAFGGGPHVCIGQHLARMEMRTALNLLLDRLPNLRLDPDHPPPLIKGLTMRAPEELHVVFG